MRLPSPYREQRARIPLQVTPLVDCAILLLIYCIWTSRSGMSELSIPLQIAHPTSGSGKLNRPTHSQDEDFDPVVIQVRRQDQELAWVIQDAPAGSLAELQKQLQTVSQIKADVPVIIDPAGDVPWEDVLQLFDVARRSGLTAIQFAARGAAP